MGLVLIITTCALLSTPFGTSSDTLRFISLKVLSEADFVLSRLHALLRIFSSSCAWFHFPWKMASAQSHSHSCFLHHWRSEVPLTERSSLLLCCLWHSEDKRFCFHPVLHPQRLSFSSLSLLGREAEAAEHCSHSPTFCTGGAPWTAKLFCGSSEVPVDTSTRPILLFRTEKTIKMLQSCKPFSYSLQPHQ